MQNRLHSRAGFSAIEVIVVVVILGIVGAGVYVMSQGRSTNEQINDTQVTDLPAITESIQKESPTVPTQPIKTETEVAVKWQFNGSSWQAMSTPPNCPEPFTIDAPTDLSKVTSILYPGQVRGGNYKPHGGFRIDAQYKNEALVTLPIDAYLYRGSRYIEAGEVQYMLDFIHPCGVMVRLDHLHTLTPEFAAIVEKLPEPKVDDSRTHDLAPINYKAGTEIAIKVGFVKNNNSTFDFGVYDLRKPNEASKDQSYASQRGDYKETTFHAQCWFDWLSASDEALVRSLPGDDVNNGKKSDYCR